MLVRDFWTGDALWVVMGRWLVLTGLARRGAEERGKVFRRSSG